MLSTSAFLLRFKVNYLENLRGYPYLLFLPGPNLAQKPLFLVGTVLNLCLLPGLSVFHKLKWPYTPQLTHLSGWMWHKSRDSSGKKHTSAARREFPKLLTLKPNTGSALLILLHLSDRLPHSQQRCCSSYSESTIKQKLLWLRMVRTSATLTA